MSKKHLEEQKLLIENFNKWINENEESSEIEEEQEQVDEVLGITAGILAASAAGAKFVKVLQSALNLFNNATRINNEIQEDPNESQEVKQAAAALSKASLPEKILTSLIKKYTGQDIHINIPQLSGPPPEEAPTEEPTPEDPEDMEYRRKLGLMSKEEEGPIEAT